VSTPSTQAAAGKACASLRASGRGETPARVKVRVARGPVRCQFLLVGAPLASFVKYLVARHRDQAERAHTLNELRKDLIRRVTAATNRMRRAPLLITAHRTAKTYNEAMKESSTAVAELRAVAHEIGRSGAEAGALFRDADVIRTDLLKMQRHLGPRSMSRAKKQGPFGAPRTSGDRP
jgi:hypothetical protein